MPTSKKSKTSADPRKDAPAGSTDASPAGETELHAHEPTNGGGAAGGRNNQHLSPSDLDQFRDILIEKRHQLAGDVDALRDDALRRSRKDAAGDLSSMPIHMADIGTDNYEQEFTLELMENDQTLLKEIDEALARIEQGTYGVCLATGKGSPRAACGPSRGRNTASNTSG